MRHTAPSAPPETDPGFGAGVIVDAAGVILTNNHVVADTDSVDITLADGRKIVARDIRIAGPGGTRAFITTAHRGQNVPFDPQLTTPGVGRAERVQASGLVRPFGQGPVDRREPVGLHFIPHHAAQGAQDEGQHGHVPQRHPQPDRTPSAERAAGMLGESLHVAPISCFIAQEACARVRHEADLRERLEERRDGDDAGGAGHLAGAVLHRALGPPSGGVVHGCRNARR